MRIGFFDSGIGGLTVLREALRELPHEQYLYYADTDHAPYGTKSKEEVRKYIFEATEFIAQQGVKALVVACNTATVIAINDLRERYDFPILGMEPAVKPAVERNRNKNKRVLVTATPLALKQEKFLNLLTKVDDAHLVDLLPLPELVVYAEAFVDDEETILQYLRKQLSHYDLKQYGTVVLGCTHFPIYRDVFKKTLPHHMDIIDGSIGTIRHLKNILDEKGLLTQNNETGNIDFFTSGRKEIDKDRLGRYAKILNL